MAEKEVKKEVSTPVNPVWIGSPRKVFKGSGKVVDLRTCTAEQLEGFRKKYPSHFKK